MTAPGSALRARTATIDAPSAPVGAPAATPMRFPIALSSDAIIDIGRGYREQLLHAPANIDFTRYEQGGRQLPVLQTHNERTFPVGRVTHLHTDGHVLRGTLELASTERGREAAQLVSEGMLVAASVGYSVQRDEPAADALGPFARVTRWTPLELSLCAIPADASVGVGRSGVSPATPQRSEVHMSEPTPAPEARSAADERSRQREIREIGRLNEIEPDRIERWIDEGITVDRMAREIVRERRHPVNEVATSGSLDLSYKDRQAFSFGRLLRALVSGDWRAAGYEREVSREIGRRMGRDTPGAWAPYEGLVPQRRVLSTGTATGAGDATFGAFAGVIEMLRPNMVALKLGAQMIPGLTSNASFVRQTGTGGATWVQEAPAAGLAASDLAIDLVTLAPKTLQSVALVSRQNIVQSSPDLEGMIRADLMAAHAVALDAAAFMGSGTANQPVGVWSQAGVGSVAAGGALTLANVIAAEKTVEDANAILGQRGWVTTPGVKAAARQIQRFSGTNGEPLWTDDEKLVGTPAYATSQLPSNLGVGTNEHAAIFGDFSQVLIGSFGAGFELVVDPYTLADRNLIKLSSFQMADIAVWHPQAFCKLTGLTAA